MGSASQPATFSHITIEPENQPEDEVVIFAGSAAKDHVCDEASVEDDVIRGNENGGAPKGVLSQTDRQTPVDVQSQAGTQSQLEERRQANTQSHTSAQSQSDTSRMEKQSGYQETTLEDLQSHPLPKLQRGVLIGIAVIVIAFVVYMLIFM